MSLPRPSEGKDPSQLKEGVAAAAASSSSSWNRLHTFPPLTLQNKSSKIDSDEDMFTVPDVEATPIVNSAVTLPNSNNLNQRNVTDPQFQPGFTGKRRRGRNPADKEYRRLKSPNLPLHKPPGASTTLPPHPLSSLSQSLIRHQFSSSPP